MAITNFGSPCRTGNSRCGRKPILRSVDLLGLALWFLKSCDPPYKLCLIFGVIPSTLYCWLNYALEVLYRLVQNKNIADFEIRWPSPAEMKSSCQLLESNRQNGFLLKGVFAVVDGARMPWATYADPKLQNAYWEGFTQGHEVTNLLVWNFYGEIIFAAVNFLGSWHDSRLAAAGGLYYPLLIEETPPGFAILGDSAFPRTDPRLKGKIVRARKTNEIGPRSDAPHSYWLSAVDTILERSMPSERQSAEWGVRGLKRPFKRLTIPLTGNAYKRKRIISLCAHLHNFRTRFLGRSQIRTAYSGNNCEFITG